MSSLPDQSKKKTRRRLRVSCVECTRRRQKCDRTQPCGLCRTRGVEHLCRWELEPFARPPPARPPGAPKTGAAKHPQQGAKIGAPAPLRLVTKANDIPLDPLLQVDISVPNSASPQSGISSVSQDVKEAAIALAQLSVARQGEYLGMGSIVCALHKMDGTFGTTQVPIDKSADAPFSSNNELSSVVSSQFLSSLQALIYNLPEKHRCDALVSSFFDHENWRFTLPQKLISDMYSRMWETIQVDLTSLNRIKVHWLTLLFAVFALSPGCTSEEESRKYFLQSLTGRRLAEDLFAASFAAPRAPAAVTEGTAQGCLAAVLLANYMCDRGQVSEAWKLIGSAVRCAQNAGLHLNPAWTKWKDMTEDEQLIRRTAWLLLAQQDKFLSFILGRPGMIRARDYDVPLPKIPLEGLAVDGSSSTDLIYLTCLTSLIDIVGESKSRFLCVHPELYTGGANLDAEFEAWKAGLPPCFDFRQPDTSLDHAYPHMHMQRCTLAILYFACSMLFHRSLPYAQPPPLHLPHLPPGAPQFDLDFRKLTTLAINLLRSQHSMRSFAHIWRQRQPYFLNTFFVFEAAVTLSIALRREPNNPNAEDWRKEREAAISMLESMRESDSGDIIRQGALVLRVLQESKSAGPDIYKPMDFGITLASTASVPSMGIPPWLQVPDTTMPSMATTQPFDLLHSLHVPLEWMADGMSGSVTAFDLLHSLEK